MRNLSKKLFSILSIITLTASCAGKDEQFEDPISDDDSMSESGYDYFGDDFDSDNAELTDDFGPIDDGSSAFGDLDPYSENDSDAGADLGYDDDTNFVDETYDVDNDSFESYDAYENSAASYDDYENYDNSTPTESYEQHETEMASPTTTMPQHDTTMSAGNESGRYIVQPGDTLAQIAGRVYQDMNRWRELANLNNIANPKMIHPGDVIQYDTNDQNGNDYAIRMNGSYSTVTVENGDTLAAISLRIFGTQAAWKYLWRFNEDAVSNPHRIYAGQELRYRQFDRNGRGVAH